MTTIDDLSRVEREYRERPAPDNVTRNSVLALKLANTIAAYIAAQRERAAGGWQPIETAPRDGTFFLAISAGVDRRTGRPWQPAITAINTDGDFVPDDFHEDYFTVCANEWHVTHWMPLPTPPKESPNG